MIPERPFDRNSIYDVDMTAILADPKFNCRGPINPSEVQELAKDIRDKGGLLQPVVIQPWKVEGKPNIKFRLIAGFRRYTAHQVNMSETIACVVKEGMSEIDARVMNLSENIQRTNLNLLQEAEGLEVLKDRGLDQGTIAKKIGKSRGWVQERYYLLELPKEIQLEAAAGNLTLKNIRNIWALPSVQQQYEFVKNLKKAKERVQQPTVEKTKAKGRNEKRLRTKKEIFETQEIIREYFGNGIGTRALAWTAGEISDLEIHQFIADHARKNGKFYAIPDGLHGHAKVTESADDATVVDTDDLDDDLKILFADDGSGTQQQGTGIIEHDVK